MPDKDAALRDLHKYVSTDWIPGKMPVDGLLEKVVLAVEAGATHQDLKKALKGYLPDHSIGDLSYG